MSIPTDPRAATWTKSAAYWLLGWGVVSLAITVTLLIFVLLRVLMLGHGVTEVAGDVAASLRSFDGTVVTVSALLGAVAIGITIALATLVALPLQTVALHLRRRRADNAAYAAVAVLSCLSALLSFAILYRHEAVLMLVGGDTPVILTAILVGLYALHTAILRIGLRRATRRDMPATVG